MFMYIDRIDPKTDLPDAQYIEVRVIINNDQLKPEAGIEIIVFLKRDYEMTLSQIINESLKRAKDVLSETLVSLSA